MFAEKCGSCPLAACDRAGKVHADGETYCESYLKARAGSPTVSLSKASSDLKSPGSRLERQRELESGRFRLVQGVLRCPHRTKLAEHERIYGCGCTHRCALGKGRRGDGVPDFRECLACVHSQSEALS